MMLSFQFHRICRPLIGEIVFNSQPWRAKPIETKPPTGGIEEKDLMQKMNFAFSSILINLKVKPFICKGY